MVIGVSQNLALAGATGFLEEVLVKYLLGVPDGSEMLMFEVDSTEVSSDLVLASPREPGKVIEHAEVTLEEALGKLKPSLHKIVGTLKELSPDETSVEFSLKIGGKTGFIFAEGSAEAHFLVRMSWASGQGHATSS